MSGAGAALRVSAWPAERGDNEYNHRLTAGLRGRGHRVTDFRLYRPAPRIDVLHLHWPEKVLEHGTPGSVVRLALLALHVELTRARGGLVVWTAHNAGGHEGRHPLLRRWLWAHVARRVGLVIHLSPESQEAIERWRPRLARVPSVVVPEPWRPVSPPDGAARDRARAKLGSGPGEVVAVSLGRIRDYKRCEDIVAAFRQSPGPLRLVLGGRADPAIAERLRHLAEGDDRIELRLRRLDDDEITELHAAADVAVFAFSQILNTGSVRRALRSGCPVLAPNLTSLRSLADEVGPSLRLVEGPLAAELARLVTDAPPRPAAISADPWAEMAERTEQAYLRRIAERNRSRCSPRTKST